jgi:hypothetical protein
MRKRFLWWCGAVLSLFVSGCGGGQSGDDRSSDTDDRPPIQAQDTSNMTEFMEAFPIFDEDFGDLLASNKMVYYFPMSADAARTFNTTLVQKNFNQTLDSHPGQAPSEWDYEPLDDDTDYNLIAASITYKFNESATTLELGSLGHVVSDREFADKFGVPEANISMMRISVAYDANLDDEAGAYELKLRDQEVFVESDCVNGSTTLMVSRSCTRYDGNYTYAWGWSYSDLRTSFAWTKAKGQRGELDLSTKNLQRSNL